MKRTQPNLRIYWTDFILSSICFIILTYISYTTNNWLAYIAAGVFLYRAGAFTHELAHQPVKTMRAFKVVWNVTLGNIMMQPSYRFRKAHLVHHTTGIFSTKNDPQYPLIRSNKTLAIFLFVFLPFLLPIYNTLVCTLSNLHNNKVEAILSGNIKFTKEEYKELNAYESWYLYMLALLSFFSVKLIITLYFISVVGWFLSVCRIPLEHSLDSYKETSVYADQRLDSYTHESPLYIPIQPLGLRYHTVHHMYPGIPYHDLYEANKQLD